MKFSIIVSLFVFSVTIWGQPKTTGGGGPDYEDGVIQKAIFEDEIIDIDSETPIGKKIQLLSRVLRGIELKCTKTLKVDQFKQTFIDSYYRMKLSTLLGTFPVVPNELNCDQETVVHQCLKSSSLEMILRFIQTDPGTYKYLETNYGLKKEEAEKMLNYFSRSYKSIHGVD